MFGLTRDFIQKDGISMVLGIPEGMSADKLNMVQANMLMNSEIPYHLRLQLKEIDLKVTLEYGLSRKKMLSHLLKGEKLSMTSFFGLLLQVAQAMEEGRLYMLSATQYALHEDYIFIEGSLHSGKVYLTYIPLVSPESAVSPGEGFRSLVMALMASITELAGDGVQRLLQYCGEADFSPAGLKGLLAALLSDGDRAKPPPPNEQDSNAVFSAEMKRPVPVRLFEEKMTAKPTEETSVKRRALQGGGTLTATEANPAPWLGGYSAFQNMQEERSNQASEEESDSPQLPSTHRTYIVLGCLLGDALLWKFLYLNNPGTLWLAVCGIMTLLLMAMSVLVWTGRIALGKKEDEEELEVEQLSRGRSLKGQEWDFRKNHTGVGDPAATPKVESEARWSVANNSAVRKQPDFSAEYSSSPLPVPVAATVFLSPDEPAHKPRSSDTSRRAVPYLERVDLNHRDAAEKIELDRSSFIIGRSAEVAQYVEKSEGTSRVHAEILRNPGGYVLKDLDSRNGTTWQGETMIPYKEYPLTEGTVFTIVKGSYTFYTA